MHIEVRIGGKPVNPYGWIGSYGTYENALAMELRGELSPHTSTFDNTIRPDNRPLTQAVVLWLIPATDEWGTLDVRYSPDLSTIIQENVNLNGWQSGNALSLITRSQPAATPNGHRRVFAWDRVFSGARYPVKLQIWYTAVTPPPTTTPMSVTPTYPPPATSGFQSPSANAADIGGDGNGFEVNPRNAYNNNSQFVIDRSSGTFNLAAPCTNPNLDRHRFYDYGFTNPGLANMIGIEVRLDAKVDNTVGSPQMCAVVVGWRQQLDGCPGDTGVKPHRNQLHIR